MTWNVQEDIVSIEEYRFSDLQFRALLRYVEQGGYPKWFDGIMLFYVEMMVKHLERRDPSR